ncbi:DUF4304 domain-containing protein [Galbibacter sp. EGI 63066]|uniref:DUF4304 domain-containing protein n=1 Tax=Galbibacter sp. EGI 63066 TaxID=2993559 RepID=UPI00224960C2|nr:DUF4304 domain-containing protein [Galbibacter sp. EGI 63066]MCX2679956.1 DUF4304 domain-containing protein [Galbibacter sp. EGI 63066]
MSILKKLFGKSSVASKAQENSYPSRMNSSDFKKIVTIKLAPYLRANGWKGSGFNFVKVGKPITKVLTIQPSSAGGKFCIEIGIYFDFIKLNKNKEPKKLKTWDLEFRTRLTPESESDYWWNFPKSELEESKVFKNIIRLFETRGQDYFNSYNDWRENFFNISPSDIEEKKVWKHIPMTKIRTALFLARMHDHFGNPEKVKPLAEYGLTQVDGKKGSGLINEFNELIEKSL